VAENGWPQLFLRSSSSSTSYGFILELTTTFLAIDQYHPYAG
jgi:hypothetical protein